VRRVLLILSTTAAVMLFSAPAGALAATSSSPSSSAPAGTACVARALPDGSTAKPVMHCYATFAQAIRVATGGRVSLPATATPESVTPDQLNAGTTGPDASYVLSIDFRNNNFGSPTLTWNESSKCGKFQSATMPSGWNNDISSVANYNGCATTLYNNTNFTGATYSIGKNGSAASLGSFNDEASAQKWCPSAPC
jgi:hypothetical protein